VLDWQRIPLAEDADLNALPIEGAPGTASMGNPHMVFAVPDAEAVPLATIGPEMEHHPLFPERTGPEMEHHPLFPERTNVEICQIIDPKTVRMRVWERGGMITQACGSGACAAAVVLHRKGLTDRAITVATGFEGVLNADLHP